MFETEIAVREPFRLDYTVEVLRRLSGNVVDRISPEGDFVRALSDGGGSAVVRVNQRAAGRIRVRVYGKNGERFVPVVQRMLGTDVDLQPWFRAVESVPWMKAFAQRVRGLKPPRYPTMWEALCHSIVFQQISIHAAGAIMQRFVEATGTPAAHDGITLYPFPPPQAVLAVSEETLRGASLSINKILALQAVAGAIQDGLIDEERVAALSTPQAIGELSKLRGIGPWSAAVVLLRGLGRLDAFPLKDSGVAASLRLLHGNHETVDVDRLLETLGEQRGMLYFHLLLGRIVGAAAS